MHGVTRTPDFILNAADVISSKCSFTGETDEHNGSVISSVVTWKKKKYSLEITNSKILS